MSTERLVRNGLLFGIGWVETVTFFAILAGVILAVFIWAAFVRKPPQHHAHRRHHHWGHVKSADTSSRRGGIRSLFRRRHRRRRKERKTNATLAETGGLPAARADEPDPPVRSL